ncbi:MAG: dual specificity protein phosphatase family protein, partial [Candidatus Mariimomonas ferrooxydans]
FSDAITVFTDGAYQAVIRRFPEYKNKIVVLRHGVHLYPGISQKEARKRLLGYLLSQEDIPLTQREELKQIYYQFFSPETIVLGNIGFITPDKDPIQLYQLGQLVQAKLPFNRVIVLYIGRIQKRKDRIENLPILENLRAIHDGRKNLFFEHYLPDELLPFAFHSLDFSVFWSKSATQSGRLAHAMGTGTCVVGRRIEGIGETLDLAGLPSAASLDELAEKIERLVFDSKLKKEAKRLSREYAQQFSFKRQAQKHILLKEAILSPGKLPVLDKPQPQITFVLPGLAIAKKDGIENAPEEITAILNVADDVDIYPPPGNYHKIPLKDGVPPPVEKIEEAIHWIRKNIVNHKVLVFCRYGAGRSASVVIGYLCSIGYDYEDALRLVASKKPDINPLPSLAETLKKVLKKEDTTHSLTQLMQFQAGKLETSIKGERDVSGASGIIGRID